MTSATSERGLRLARAQQKKDAETEKLIISTLMNSVDGRRWLWLQLESFGIYAEDSDVDPYHMAFAKGKRNAGLRLLKAVTSIAPKQFVQAMEENSGQKLTEEDEDGRDPEPEFN